MNKIYDLNNISEIQGKSIFIDANVFMFVDGIIDYDNRSITYADSYFKLAKKNTLFTNEMIINEYSNRAFKYNYDLQKREDKSLLLKQYRASDDGKAVLSTISDSVRHFLDDVQLLSVRECYPSIETVLNDVETGMIDIADSVIANICMQKGLIVMSDDRDLFCKENLGVITANPWMLRKARNRRDYVI